MLDAIGGTQAKSLVADKAYDTQDFVAACRSRNVTPHVASNDPRRRGIAIDRRTTRHFRYSLSQTSRKRNEEYFGSGNTAGRIRQTVYRRMWRVDQHFKLP